MLDTVNRYIVEDESRRREGVAGFLLRGQRSALFIVFSAIVHVLFFAVVFKIDRLALDLLRVGSRQVAADGDMFKITDIASSDPLKQVRRVPEQLERANLHDLRLDLSNPDDLHLVTKSPQAAGGSGDIRRRMQPSQPRGEESPREQVRPPASQRVDLTRPPQLAGAPPTQLPSTDSGAPPPPGRPPQDAGAAGTASRERATRDSENQIVSAESGLRITQAQYYAYVRAKIWRVNERIMPRDWIERMLNRKVSADFTVSVSRSGRLASAMLTRSTGYSTLDEIARQAINTASPFEGFPPEAGDTIALTVTVYYTPYR